MKRWNWKMTVGVLVVLFIVVGFVFPASPLAVSGMSYRVPEAARFAQRPQAIFGDGSIYWPRLYSEAVVLAGIAILVLGIVAIEYARLRYRPLNAFESDADIVERLDPLQVAYANKGTVSKRDIVTLIYYWANNGYIKIEGSINKLNETGIIYKVCELPQAAAPYQHLFFSTLFSRGKERISWKSIGAVLEIVQRDVKALVKQEMQMMIYTPRSISARRRMTALALVPMTLLQLYQGNPMFRAAIPSILLLALGYLLIRWGYGIYRNEKVYRTAVSIAGILLVGASFAVSLLGRGAQYENYFVDIIVMICTALSIPILLVLTPKSPIGTWIDGQIAELREIFIAGNVRWQDFYKMFPYAYVLSATVPYADGYVGRLKTPDWLCKPEGDEDKVPPSYSIIWLSEAVRDGCRVAKGVLGDTSSYTGGYSGPFGPVGPVELSGGFGGGGDGGSGGGSN